MITISVTNAAYQTAWTGDVACTCTCIQLGRITCWPVAQVNFRITWLNQNGTPGPSSPTNQVSSISSSSHFGSATRYGCIYIPFSSCAQVRLIQVEIGVSNAATLPAPPDGVIQVKACMWVGLVAGGVNDCASVSTGGCNAPAANYDKIDLF